ncbi:lytic transglycosylase domain-containing protein [Pikeienuella piscinae]|uniref:Lytic transglycosylase domain-containing protein n=1 Tax=Pikeienuella piscinae TaxID=2748098 RepID=A0A7M3T566_9RHOB|nr:lytic transglycosylase domain-containing protein [Pikeienuella piscinae]QIE57147.1 lytic transglycosylase domain-containing protein [Pikeienuella piscinae]
MFRPAAFAAILLITASPEAARSDAASEVAASMAAADKRDWGEARSRAAAAGDPVALTLYQWRLLSAGDGDWRAYRDFVATNGDWPNLSRIRAKGEALIPPGASLGEIDAFLGVEGTQTGAGALRRAEALAAAGRNAEADQEIIRAWRSFSLTPGETAAFRAEHSGLIRPHHAARADELLWRGLTGEAQAMKPLVSADWAALIEARARVHAMGNGVDEAIAAVPASLANDPGLAWERFRWRMKKNLYDSAGSLLQSRTGSVDSLGRPEVWGHRRRLLVRRLYRQGRFVDAYNLANQNHMVGGSDYSDLEWLAGWIALRRLNDPGRAATHFSRFIAAVETPISLGRGYYWLGRAYEAGGDESGAMRAYRTGAQHQTSFYGQLAAERAGVPTDSALAAGPDGDWRRASFAGRSIVRAAQLLSAAGDRRRAHWFLTHLASTLSTYDDLAGAANLAITLNRPDAAIRIGKIAARKGHVLRGDYYPVTELARFNAGVEPALAMAIGRQESELNPEAISPAGARGLMQVMPATARKVAGWIDQPYSLARLTGDWRYNATLGQTYLARRLEQFGGSVAMAAAAYNAGAGRVDRWIASYGDPRTGAIDWIDWLETIPFDETRNYVQRVLEGLQIYRSRIAGQPVAFRLKQDALGR